jgi:hypothetical protein
MGSRVFVGGGLFICAALALFVTPAGVGAKPGYEVNPTVHVASLTLKGTHGYEVTIAERNRRTLVVGVADLGKSVFDPWSFAYYQMHQHRARANQILGRLPGLGRVLARFHPVGHPQRESGLGLPGCRGGGIVKQLGYFIGRIRFRGERGYTDVHGTRAHGELTTREKEVCKRSPEHPPNHHIPSLLTTHLRATSKSGRRLIRFSVGTFEPLTPKGRSADIHASINERRNGMRIERFILASGRRDDVLQVGDGSDFPASATVSPPDPFRGSAAFQRGAGGENSWSGSLSVPLPGAGRVPLTGPSFSVSLCQEEGCSR